MSKNETKLNNILQSVKEIISYTPPYILGKALYVAYRHIFILKGRRICLLGMPDAGKTRVLRIMQGVNYDESKDRMTPGGGESFNSFECELSDDIRLWVSEGTDRNGDEVNIKQYYEDLLEKCETVLFIFNIYKYLNDKEEEQKTNDRFDYIYKHLSKQIKELAFIGTHLDQFDKSEQRKVIDKFMDKIRGREYSDMFKCLMAIDATNAKHVKKEMCKIFKS